MSSDLSLAGLGPVSTGTEKKTDPHSISGSLTAEGTIKTKSLALGCLSFIFFKLASQCLCLLSLPEK